MNSIIHDILSYGLPLFIIAVGGIYCERSGVVNMALEGLQGIGAFAGVLTIVYLSEKFQGQNVGIMFIGMIFASIAGGILAILHGVLCLKLKSNQVISGVIVNTLAMTLTEYFTERSNRKVWESVSNRLLIEVVIVIVIFIAWFVIHNTMFGIYLRACGEDPYVVETIGKDVIKIRWFAIILSGIFSGLGGISFACLSGINSADGLYCGYGYLAITALILGNWELIPTLRVCLLFGVARTVGYYIADVIQMADSYRNLVMLLPYGLILLLAIFYSKHNEAPKVLGQIYEKRPR